jgi:hypothetical protein
VKITAHIDVPNGTNIEIGVKHADETEVNTF